MLGGGLLQAMTDRREIVRLLGYAVVAVKVMAGMLLLLLLLLLLHLGLCLCLVVSLEGVDVSVNLLGRMAVLAMQSGVNCTCCHCLDSSMSSSRIIGGWQVRGLSRPARKCDTAMWAQPTPNGEQGKTTCPARTTTTTTATMEQRESSVAGRRAEQKTAEYYKS